MATQVMPVVGLNLAEMYHFGKPVIIASWWPVEQKLKRRYKTRTDGGHLTEYVIPACPADAVEPVMVAIADAMENVYLGERRYHDNAPVPGGARVIADGLVKQLCTDQFMATPSACPGIWVVNGERPTPEESATWKKKQIEYANVCAKIADEAHGKGNQADISTLFRTMAEWNRLDPQRHLWMRDEHRGDVKPCPFCRTSIDSESVKCQKCGEVVDAAAYRRMKQTLAEVDGFTEAKLAEVKSAIPAEPVDTPPKPGTIIEKAIPGQPIHPPVKK